MTQALGLVFDLSAVDVGVEGRHNEEKENFGPKFKNPHERCNLLEDKHRPSLSDHSPLSIVFNNLSRNTSSSFKSLKRSSDLFDRGTTPPPSGPDLSRSSPPGVPLSAKKAKVIVLSKGVDQDEVMKSEEPSSENSDPPSPDENRPPFRCPSDARSGPPPLWSLPELEDTSKFIPRSVSVPLSIILNPPHSTLSRSTTIDFPFATERAPPPGFNGTIKTKVVPHIKRANLDEARKVPSSSQPPSPSSSSPSLSSSEFKKTLQSMECLDRKANTTTSPPEALSSSLSAFSNNSSKIRQTQEVIPIHTTPPPPTRMAPQLAPEPPGANVPHLASVKYQPEMINYTTENIRSQRENLLENTSAGLRGQGQRPSAPARLSRPLQCATQMSGIECRPTYMTGQPSLVDRTQEKLTSYCSGNLRIRMVTGSVSKQPSSQKKAFVYQFQ